jgi:hypothetical protein
MPAYAWSTPSRWSPGGHRTGDLDDQPKKWREVLRNAGVTAYC